MELNPTQALQLFQLGMLVKDQVTAALRGRHGADYQPTDADIEAELHANVKAGLEEGEAWRAAHPTPASGS